MNIYDRLLSSLNILLFFICHSWCLFPKMFSYFYLVEQISAILFSKCGGNKINVKTEVSCKRGHFTAFCRLYSSTYYIFQIKKNGRRRVALFIDAVFLQLLIFFFFNNLSSVWFCAFLWIFLNLPHLHWQVFNDNQTTHYTFLLVRHSCKNSCFMLCLKLSKNCSDLAVI